MVVAVAAYRASAQSACETLGAVMNRKSYSLKKPSNRARMKAANAAIKYAAQLEQMLKVGAENSNGLQATICALLAQKGGEVTITPGTMAQLAEQEMGFQIKQGPGEGEFTLMLVPASPDAPPEEEADAPHESDPEDIGGSLNPAG